MIALQTKECLELVPKATGRASPKIDCDLLLKQTF